MSVLPAPNGYNLNAEIKNKIIIPIKAYSVNFSFVINEIIKEAKKRKRASNSRFSINKLFTNRVIKK